MERVELIQQLYGAGLPSHTILELLPCVDTGSSTPAVLDRLQAERARLDDSISRTVQARRRLDDIIDRTRICPTSTPTTTTRVHH